jgi:ATP-dependent DNA helicase RecG
LSEGATPFELLTHLNLLDEGRPTHAAILLFGKQPQRFLISSELKCAHFHGTEVAKSIPSYQVYKGTVFDLVDQKVLEPPPLLPLALAA